MMMFILAFMMKSYEQTNIDFKNVKFIVYEL